MYFSVKEILFSKPYADVPNHHHHHQCATTWQTIIYLGFLSCFPVQISKNITNQDKLTLEEIYFTFFFQKTTLIVL